MNTIKQLRNKLKIRSFQQWNTIKNSDLNELYQQKLALVNRDYNNENIEGLINFLDYLLDEAEEKGLFKYPDLEIYEYTAQSIALIWSIEDVQEVRKELTDEQAMKVLDNVKNHHDATVGVNWETLEFWANELFPIKNREKEC